MGCGAESTDPPTDSADTASTGAEDATESDAEAPADTSEASDDGPPRTGDVACTEKYGKACTQDNSVIWVDSCGNPGVVFELCGSTKVCAGGGCQETCEPHAEQKCQGGNLFWYDSCANIEEVAVACAQWCENDVCVEGTLDGTWLVTAEPGQQQLGGAGQVSYGQRTATVVIDGSDVTASFDVGSPNAQLTGTIDDQTLTLSGSWAEVGPPALEHDVTFEAQLTGPTVFFGVEQDTVTSLGVAQGKLVWNVQGSKQ
ncbi:MAG: hypothetical protein ACI9WU_004073 [Myxococcota bacterium]|jgi:hypothetical protein